MCFLFVLVRTSYSRNRGCGFVIGGTNFHGSVLLVLLWVILLPCFYGQGDCGSWLVARGSCR